MNDPRRLSYPVLALMTLVPTLAAASVVVPGGARVYFSPRGQAYFKTRLEKVLVANQVDLSKTTFERLRFVLNDPFDMNKLPADTAPEKRAEIEILRERLAGFFYGFPVKTPKIEFNLDGSRLDVKFKALGAEVDPRGPEAYGRKKGVVILLRAESENLRFTTAKLRLTDLANQDLFGVTGADDAYATLRDPATRPVRVELPVLLDAGPKGAKVEVLAIRSNLQLTPFTIEFGKLLLPTITLVINGRELVFDHAAFEAELRAMLPEIGEMIAAQLKDFFDRDGKSVVQPMFDTVAKSLDIEFGFDFPSGLADSSKRAPDPAVQFALHPAEARYRSDRHLGLVFDAELKDPRKTTKSRAPLPKSAAGEPALAALDRDSYDASLVLHPSALNAVIGRAWEQGTLREIELGKDDRGRTQRVKLPKSPVLSFPAGERDDRALFHAWVDFPVKGIGSILFKKPIPIELDLYAKIETTSKSEIEAVIERIDLDTLKVDTSATWLRPLRAKVEKLVREKIGAINADAAAKRTTIITIPGLEDLVKIPVRLKTARSDGGNLVLYEEFAVDSE
jgi:hypothetical protein